MDVAYLKEQTRVLEAGHLLEFGGEGGEPFVEVLCGNLQLSRRWYHPGISSDLGLAVDNLSRPLPEAVNDAPVDGVPISRACAGVLQDVFGGLRRRQRR